MSIAFLFAGQGSQKVGMGKDLYENNEIFRETIDSIHLDFDLKNTMFEGPMEILSETRFTQPCMAAFAVGVTKILYSKGIKPDYVAGLSLGEYSALYSSGVFDEQTLINLVAFRGKAMSEAAEGISCKMSAVLGMESEKIRQICEEISTEDNYVTVSNYNCKGQYVICGNEAAVIKAEEKLKENGAKRCIPLKVSGPFHTKFMKPAGEALKNYFESISFNSMRIPVVFNTTAKELQDGENIKELLVKQVQESIYMEDTIYYLEKAGVDTVIEIGPGKALSGFVKKTSNKIDTYVIEDLNSLNAVIEALEK